jgi:rfaE bifunctional protein nucleotidyltransferase chain/domain
MKTVFTNGCFDLLHIGHIKFLEQASSLGDWLCVGLNSDNSIRKLKGFNRPINPYHFRRKMLESLRFVDQVYYFDDDIITLEDILDNIRPDILVKGDDWSLEDIRGKDLVESYGGEVKIISARYTSTTEIIQRIKSL